MLFVSPAFEARVTKDSLVFSAAHFITLGGGVCERLHGHNWRVDVVIAGDLDENHYVFDFLAIRDAAERIVQELDHRMLLPDRHPDIRVQTDDQASEVTVRFHDRRWVFPQDDCRILPMANTTAERLAEWIAGRLIDALELTGHPQVAELKVGVEENFGQWAWYRRRPAADARSSETKRG